MKVYQIVPRGYCKGVVRAIEIAKKYAFQDDVYILGMIVHNQYIVDALENLGIKTIDKKGASREELLDFIDKGTVIITAHGAGNNVFKKAKAKNLNVVDATCLDVIKTHDLIKDYLNKGFNYPTSLAKALKDFDIVLDNNPNDLLGIGYIRNLKNVEIKVIKRTNDYHSLDLENISSATSIREALKEGIDVRKYVPKESYESLNDLHFFDDYFNLLKYKILSIEDLSIYQTVDEGIENKIKKEILKANNIDELINLVKSKRYTYNKLKRMFLHILCSFTKEEARRCIDIQYIRVLGFNEKGRKYLNSIKKTSELPILTKYDNSFEMMRIENRVSNIYNMKKDGFLEEYKHKPIIF